MKRVFISGASRGIGLECARRFHKEGFETIICARNEDGLKSAAAEIPGLITYQCDIGDVDQVKALAATIREKHGPLDVLINNGGVFIPGEMTKEDDATFEMMLNVNVKSAYYFTKAFIGDMKEQKAGTVVNMCSIASLMAYAAGGTYSITKFALLGMSKALREEMKPHGIRVISVMPGATFTSSWDGAGIPAERMMPPEDIAEVVWTSYALSGRTVMEDVVLRPQLGDV